MRILQPIALLLLVTVPVLIVSLWLGRRRRAGVRRIVPLAIRLIAIVALVLATAGLQTTETGTGADVVYVVDVSDSVGPEGQKQAEQFVADALAQQNEADRAAIVLFGAEPAVERGMQHGLARLTHESIVDSSSTSTAQAVLKALSLFADDRERQIVVLSDGQETSGDLIAAARGAARAGVTVSTVPLETQPSDGEVFVRRVIAPVEVRVDEVHEFSVVIAATESADAVVEVLRDGLYYGEDQLRLAPGDNTVLFQGSFSDEGVHRYSVLVTTMGDPTSINNEAEALIRVTGQPSVLYVASEPASAVVDALSNQGFVVASFSTAAMPKDIHSLVSYDAIVFDNVPAYDLSVPAMEAIERFVRDTGGGFIMIGGDESFGAGGYYRTPIERALPVDMDVTTTMRIPSLAMVFVIDKSGSMGSVEASGSTKLDLVKEAVISSVEIMNPYYNVGLLAFDADFEWTVPITRAGERESIVTDLTRLASGGGTVLEGSLSEAHRVLALEQAAVKHVIVLSDGLTSDADFETLVTSMVHDAITVSTVSVGASSDRDLMSNIAEWGLGRSYHAASSSSVPRIFASETQIVSRNLIVEETFLPRVSASSPILQGIDPLEIPPLKGFVLAYHKSGAQQVLAGSGENPVLSVWQYGLGRSAAFTSDLRAKWATEWLEWDKYSQFIAQLVRWTQRPAGTSGFRTQFRSETDTTRIIVDAVEADGRFRNLLDLRALVQPPGGETYEATLDQERPGRYSVEIPTGGEGNYLVTVFGDPETPPQTYGLSVPYAQEYIQFETNYDLMERAANAGGGQVYGPDGGQSVYVAGLSGRTFSDTLWLWLVVAGILALIVELIFKKLILPIGSIQTTMSRAKQTEKPQKRSGRAADEQKTPLPSYQELKNQVAMSYRRETVAERDFKRWYDGGEHNPVAERKIHIARKRR